jgi:hypothetical protein
MEHKFDINRPDFYYGSSDLRERTKNRLTEIAECGMEEVMTAEFGYSGVVSGLYIETVWYYSDEEFRDYMDWAKALIEEHS